MAEVLSMAIPFSILDLAPIVEEEPQSVRCRTCSILPGHAERYGYHRYWPSGGTSQHARIASAATAILIAHVAGGTRTIVWARVESLLPNHARSSWLSSLEPLETLYPGRIDSDWARSGNRQAHLRALRRDLETNVEAFAEDVHELRPFLRSCGSGQAVRAIPGVGLNVHSLSWDRACSGHRWQQRSACPLRSHRISRPML